MNTKQTPIERLRHHVTGAIERGEKSAIVAVTDSGKAPSVKPSDLIREARINLKSAISMMVTNGADNQYIGEAQQAESILAKLGA